MPTREDLKYFQSMPLSVKVGMTKTRIREWVNYYGEEGCYVSFSGGKDSTVLLDIVRNQCGYDKIPFVFVNTGLEYPEIVQFVKSKMTDIDVMLKPEMNFKQVIQKYGYPFISKAVSQDAYESKRFLLKQMKERGVSGSVIEYAKNADISKVTYKTSLFLGKCDEYKSIKRGIEQKYETRSKFDKRRYLFLLDAPFEVSSKCCDVMKKNPVHKYTNKTGRVSITAQMAEESLLRETNWYKRGCNSFEGRKQSSNPMAFWTEQDVLQYIKQNGIQICSVYGDIVAEDSEGFQYFDPIGGQKLMTTGCKRTGCMFCGYSCHREKNGKGRFEVMRQTHPKIYDYIMKPTEQGGLGYMEVIDWLNANGNLNIKY